jgi:hypothetical protein
VLLSAAVVVVVVVAAVVDATLSSPFTAGADALY